MLKPIKRLGQNFLQDPNTIRKIVDAITPAAEDAVVEIGPGTGALTGLLSQRYHRFSAIEIDPRAAELLRETLPGVDIIEGDVLDVSWADLATRLEAPRLCVIGNLPYYITSQILFSLLDAAPLISEVVIMMQYEVAARLIASPRTKEYGILSVAVQLSATPKLLFPVSRNVFYPRPDVRSAVVRLSFPEKLEEHGGVDPKFLRRLVRMAFNQRRKTLRNSLSALTAELGVALPENVTSRRAEELAPEDFVDLALYLLRTA